MMETAKKVPRGRRTDDSQQDSERSAAERVREWAAQSASWVGEDDEDGENGHAQSVLNGDRNLNSSLGLSSVSTSMNFVTIQICRVLPGPNLNMVIGPILVWARVLLSAPSALGQGITTASPGRPRILGDYVKRGSRRLPSRSSSRKRPQDPSESAVIRLHINAEDSRRTFWINGKDAGIKAVQNLMELADPDRQPLPVPTAGKGRGFRRLDALIELLDRTMQAVASSRDDAGSRSVSKSCISSRSTLCAPPRMCAEGAQRSSKHGRKHCKLMWIS